MTGLDETLAPLKNSRSYYKVWITHALRELETLKNSNNLDVSMFKRLEQTVNNHVQRIEDIKIKINVLEIHMATRCHGR